MLLHLAGLIEHLEMVPLASLQGGFNLPAFGRLGSELVKQRIETGGSRRQANLEAILFPREAGAGGK
jgi:hypothetical protein